MLEIILTAVGGLVLGSVSIWLYYREKFTEVLTELEDKKVIIKTIHQHADEIERANVKQFAKEQFAKVAKKEKIEKSTSSPKRKYKKSAKQ